MRQMLNGMNDYGGDGGSTWEECFDFSGYFEVYLKTGFFTANLVALVYALIVLETTGV